MDRNQKDGKQYTKPEKRSGHPEKSAKQTQTAKRAKEGKNERIEMFGAKIFCHKCHGQTPKSVPVS